jgi:hypothetical protein
VEKLGWVFRGNVILGWDARKIGLLKKGGYGGRGFPRDVIFEWWAAILDGTTPAKLGNGVWGIT